MKVLCAALPGPGHGYPMLAVARGLARRGHEVVFASGPRHATDAEQAGARLVELPYTPGSSMGALTPYEDSLGMARAFADGVASIAPDVAVVDLLTLGAALACEVNGVPHATLSVHALHTPSRDLPPFGWGEPPGRGVFRLRDTWMRAGNRGNLERARDALNKARTALGLPPTDRLDGQLSSDLVILPTLPSLEIPRSDWPAFAHVVGPCLWDADGPAIEPPAGDGPVVLVALSTAHDHGTLAHVAADAALASGARVVVTTGATDIAFDAHPRVVAVPFARHDSLIPQCDVVVCNGGHGIMARALSNGVPLIVIPGHGDQRENGYRVERARAGIRVLKPEPQALRRAITRVLDEPAFRKAALAIQAEAAALDGPARAAELVEALAEHGNTEQRKTEASIDVPDGEA